MYYVYSLLFGKHLYIGCTNNIRRRKDQHNGNAKKRKGKLGRFLNDNNIYLKREDFRILFSSDDRHEALMRERDIAKECDANGYEMLNDNYTNGCSRKGKSIGKTAKKFIVVNVIEHSFEEVVDLRQYAIAHGLNYKALHSTAKYDALYRGVYHVCHAKDWDSRNQDEYLSGEHFRKKKAESMKAFAEKTSKTYEVEFPDGHVELIHNLDEFARNHGLTGGTLHATLSNGKRTKGYRAIRRIEKPERSMNEF